MSAIRGHIFALTFEWSLLSRRDRVLVAVAAALGLLVAAVFWPARLALMALGGAALNRLRGSSRFKEMTGRGATTARLLLAVYLGVCAWLVDNGSNGAWALGTYFVQFYPWRPHEIAWSCTVLILLPALVFALWFGMIGKWHGSLDMGTREGTVWRDLALHSLVGVWRTVFAAALLWFASLGTPWLLLIIGALCGPIYLAAWRLAPAFPVECAEWANGAAVAAALLISVALT